MCVPQGGSGQRQGRNALSAEELPAVNALLSSLTVLIGGRGGGL